MSLIRRFFRATVLNIKRIFNGRLLDIFAGWLFDWRHNVDTGGKITLDRLEIDSANVKSGVFYSPTIIGLFKKMLRDLDEDFSQFTFVDYGCGKGRTLLLASDFPFKKIIGLDFAGYLCDVASQNFTTYRSSGQRCHDLEAITMDATKFDIPDGHVVLYFFNPFGAPVMAPVLEKIESAAKQSGRDLYVVYYNPVCRELFDQSNYLDRYRSGKRYIIWKNRS